MENITTLKQTANKFVCIGRVYQKSLEKSTTKIKAGPKDKKEEIETGLISGSIAISIPSGTVTFPVWATEIGNNGQENYMWNIAQAMIDEWVPKIGKGAGEPTRVRIEGELKPNDYFNRRTQKAAYQLGYRIRSANTRVTDTDEDGMSLTFDAYVNGKQHEVKNEEETGRLILDLYGVTYNGEVYPIKVYVEEDAAELIDEGGELEDAEFEAFEEEQTRTEISCEYLIRGGAVKKTRRSIREHKGPDSSSSAATYVELSLYNAFDKAVEEPDELTTTDENGNEIEVPTLWINPKAFREALKERARKIEEINKTGGNKSDKDSKSTGSIKAKKAAMKKQAEESFPEDDEDPFDFDD